MKRILIAIVKSVAFAFVILIAARILLACYGYEIVGPFNVIQSNDSPDGRYRHLTEVQDPVWPMASPVVYRYRVIELRTSKEVPGSRSTFDKDSAHYDEYEQPYVWTKEAVEELDKVTSKPSR